MRRRSFLPPAPLLILVGLLGVQACVKANSEYDWDPAWNKPPNEKAQTPADRGSSDLYYQQMKDEQKAKNRDSFFEKFYERGQKSEKK